MFRRFSTAVLLALVVVTSLAGCATTPPARTPAAVVDGATPVRLTGAVRPGATAAMTQLGPILDAAGLRLTWHAGQRLALIAGPASAIERYFGVALVMQRDRTGFHFAPAAPPRVPVAVTAAISSLVGFDGRVAHRNMLTSTDPQTGYTAADMVKVYNALPLQQAGNLGQGQTIVMLEIDTLAQQTDLTDYAAANSLPPFDVSVRTDTANWGTADSSHVGESNLDVEVAHAIAPKAKLVLYETGGRAAEVLAAAQTAIQEFPHAIVSESLGICEGGGGSDVSAIVDQEEQLAQQVEAGGGSWFVSSGDSGSFGCAQAVSADDPQFSLPSVNIFGDPAGVTSVGGTTTFISGSGGYGTEAAWGAPLERSGSGGGVSIVTPEPAFQTGPGVSNRFSNGNRQQPDVAANADPLTGWRIIIGGQTGSVGGTSAAAPMWAASIALVDTALAQQGLPGVGNANIALYRFGANPDGQPARPFHDITLGNNFSYPATPGYDLATGWGSPDMAALTQDWIAFVKAGG